MVVISACSKDDPPVEPITIVGQWQLMKLEYVTYDVSTHREITRKPFKDYSSKKIIIHFKNNGAGDVIENTTFFNAFNFTHTDSKLAVTYAANVQTDKYLHGHGEYVIDGDNLLYKDNYNVDPVFPGDEVAPVSYNRYVFSLKRVSY